MTDLVPGTEIEGIVGVARHRAGHFGRAVTAEDTVYILHSQRCLDSGVDLRECRFSRALDHGIHQESWETARDVPVLLGIWDGLLIPLRVEPAGGDGS